MLEELRHSKFKSGPTQKMNGQPIFYLHEVSLKFGSIKALENVTTPVNRGEMLFVTGPSGAGKTSFLNVLSGRYLPTQGQLEAQRQLFIGEIFQDLKLLPTKTFKENLYLAFDKTVYSSKNEFEKELNSLCELFAIRHRLHLKPAEGNGGLKQKVAIIRSLLSRPDIILADEPTCSLDKESAIRVHEVLSYYNRKKGITIVWATHNKELIKQFSGRILHLDKGKLIYSGHACFI